MADPSEQATLSPGLKRTHDGVVIATQYNLQPTLSQHFQLPSFQRAPSPALSNASSSLSELSSTAPPNPMTGSASSPIKKRKLTFAERQAQQAEKQRLKDEKERLKAEDKARKDEEKRVKDEEKRKKAEEKENAKKLKEVEKAQKDAERAEKQKVKDAEKAEKDAQKAQKEAEKLKKERAQMRLGAFFGRPAPASTPPSTPDDVSSGVSSRRSSIASIDMEQPLLDPKPSNVVNPEFSSWILPFFPHEHTDVAPYNRFLRMHNSTNEDGRWVDQLGRDYAFDATSLKQAFGPPKIRKTHVRPVRALFERLNGAEDTPIDLTEGSEVDPDESPTDRVPFKILHFAEDVRPPYQGTFTRPVSPRTARKLPRRPTARALPQVDYDYDSEAEWEAPQIDDEDLEDEDELSDEEEAADEMNDFLDDEGEIARRRVTSSDAEPSCTGLCWEEQTDLVIDDIDLSVYRMDLLHDDTRLPIDPYSSVHWSQPITTTPLKAKAPLHPNELTPSMQPPRLPLVAVSAPNNSPLKTFVTTNGGLGVGQEQKENTVPNGEKKQKKPVKTISPELLPSFKQAVSGSDLNKVALIEILKKQFPKCPKDAIKGSLETIAVRQGAKEADKRWVLIA